MKRPTAVSNLSEEEVLCLPFSNSYKSSHSYRDENTSPYNSYNNTQSDTESLSDGSKKIRKKRNAYQKISDDIRVDLLESVQNGETLKAAAKRHKINYSSAKSILHTYRKEGRILKKSAQERTVKRKSSAEDTKQPAKVLKSCKKDNIKATSKGSKSSRRGLNIEKMSPDCMDNLLNDKDEVKTATTVSEKNCNGLSKTDYYLPEQEEKGTYQPLTITPSYHIGHSIFGKEDDSALKILLNNENRGVLDVNQTLKNISNGHHQEYEEDNAAKYRLYDNLYMNQGNLHVMEGANAQIYAESPDRAHAFLPKEFESFSDMMNPVHNRQAQFEDYYHNSNGFMYQRKFNNFANKMDYEGHEEHASYFMDPQRLFQESMAKASLLNYGGNLPGYRKKSHEFY